MLETSILPLLYYLLCLYYVMFLYHVMLCYYVILYLLLYYATFPASHSSLATVANKQQTLKDNSRFSPPQILYPGSYRPSSSKYSLSIANNPPAIVGDLKGK